MDFQANEQIAKYTSTQFFKFVNSVWQNLKIICQFLAGLFSHLCKILNFVAFGLIFIVINGQTLKK